MGNKGISDRTHQDSSSVILTPLIHGPISVKQLCFILNSIESKIGDIGINMPFMTLKRFGVLIEPTRTHPM